MVNRATKSPPIGNEEWSRIAPEALISYVVDPARGDANDRVKTVRVASSETDEPPTGPNGPETWRRLPKLPKRPDERVSRGSEKVRTIVGVKPRPVAPAGGLTVTTLGGTSSSVRSPTSASGDAALHLVSANVRPSPGGAALTRTCATPSGRSGTSNRPSAIVTVAAMNTHPLRPDPKTSTCAPCAGRD